MLAAAAAASWGWKPPSFLLAILVPAFALAIPTPLPSSSRRPPAEAGWRWAGLQAAALVVYGGQVEDDAGDTAAAGDALLSDGLRVDFGPLPLSGVRLAPRTQAIITPPLLIVIIHFRLCCSAAAAVLVREKASSQACLLLPESM